MANDNIGHGISFVIPALDEELLVGRCIKSIKAEIERSGINAEIIVVDNGSIDATAHVATVNGATVMTERRRGITFAKSAGFNASRHPIVAFIDADCMLREGWIERALYAFRNPRIIAVSGPYRYYDIRLGRQLAKPIFGMMDLLGRVTPMMMGGNNAVRRTALEKVGLDTSFTFWGEDTKLAIELSKVGRIKFDMRLAVDSSGRRLQDQGYLSTFVSYLVNTVAVRLSGRAAMREHRNFR